jgi:hypothetical protein
MKRTVSVLALLVAALCIGGTSQAQNAPAAGSAPPATPAPQTPPPNYPPPPPRYPGGNTYPGGSGYPGAPPSYYAPAPPRQWMQAPEMSGVYRPFSFTVGVGPGYLHGPGNTRELAISYNLFRIGFGVAPNVSFVLAFEGTGVNTFNDAFGEYSFLKQENWLLGLQYHLLRRLYVRGGVGAGFISEHTDSFDIPGPGTGLAMAGAIGYEFVQTPHVALALDLNGSVTKYARREYWGTTGLNLAVSFY